ncbi:hypothetical protein BaRGS_00029505 [Batillaria attramentaria]|uniref:Secreted protein n=1 Tax=Batillaria attramentaria TaxID=370345 RepID=A0ABD0JW15_9CAEN
MLLAESFTLILLTFPFSVHLIVTLNHRGFAHGPREKQNQRSGLFHRVLHALRQTRCVNFLVYCLAGQRFRQAIVKDVLQINRCRKSGPEIGVDLCGTLKRQSGQKASCPFKKPFL